MSEERQGLMASGAYEDDGDAVIEMDLLPPRWLDVQDEITEHLAQVAKQTRKLDQLHQKHVLPGFDDEDVKKREEREIEQLTQEIRAASRGASRLSSGSRRWCARPSSRATSTRARRSWPRT
jgi:syntaxin 16